MSLIKNTFILFVFVFFSCENSLEINTHKNTYHDSISDITYLNESFFTTNYDISGNAGPQVDLIKIVHDGELARLDNKFDLGLNGQGFLTVTNDGNDIFLQSRSTSLILKSSVIGEVAFSQFDDTLATYWLPSGLSYDSERDSLIFLYRNMNSNETYLLRLLSKDISPFSTRTVEFTLENLDTTYNGVYAMTYENPHLYLLAVNNYLEDVLLTIDYNTLSVTNTELIGDSTVTGIEIVSDSIYLSFRDRSITFFRGI